MSPTQFAEAPVLTAELLSHMDTPGPRYTSYPTADRFAEGFGPAQALDALALRASDARAGRSAPLSIYVHVPFCESLCYYCACNKVITKHHERAGEYLDAVEQEIALIADTLGPVQEVSQLHLGGGTPTFLSDAELTRLMDKLRQRFRLAADAEIAIEVDPRTVDEVRLGHLATLGFNRLSFGVQDFEPSVQKAVHRVQPEAQVQALMASARRIGFESINIDLIYGLPLQTPASMASTVHKVAALRPDRVALYSYAHLPQRFKPQRRIDAAQLPRPGARIEMLSVAIAGFIGHGYSYIGMDHFALPDDSLAVAKREGRLHRNFQGYSTRPDCDLIALGVSAISRVGDTYSQNAKTLPEYYDALRQGRLPVVRGLALSADDVIRRAVIMALMCQGRVEYKAIESAHGIDMTEYFRSELVALQPLVDAGFVLCNADSIQLTATGWYFVRAVAMVFDKYLAASATRDRFSRVI
jgi:oxygen-independent coproporphyrinogen-3 oxidase